MSHVAHAHVRAAALEETPSDLRHRAWIGPAIGASVLAIAWAIYLVPVFIGIVTAVPAR